MAKVHCRNKVSGFCHIIAVNLYPLGIANENIGKKFITDIGSYNFVIIPDIVVFINITDAKAPLCIKL